jgi:hypothetical protein
MSKSKPKTRRRREGYLHKSPAVCVVLYDHHGQPIPDDVATKFINAAFELAQQNNYLVSFTRT